MRELDLPDAAGYRLFLESHPDEWPVLDRLCRITISRFWRDGPAFDHLSTRVMPDLIARARARGARALRVWSMACASGEEAYSIALAWHLRLARTCPEMSLDLIASDASEHMLARARRATYPASIFHELPSDLRAALDLSNPSFVTIPGHLRAGVVLQVIDVRTEAPPGLFDLILCRNLVFTYFSPELQSSLVTKFRALTHPGGVLMVGKGEKLPDDEARYFHDSHGVLMAR